jgi:acetylornithine deacetylase/succinyl-diaminopimelate desuccinylase-like protein
VVTPIEEPFVQRVIDLSASFSEARPSVAPLMGGTLPLLGALRRHVGVPGLTAPAGAGYWGSGAHAPNEHIRLEDLPKAVRFNCHLFQGLGEKGT